MHKLIHYYARVLNILIGISVALLVVPVTLQMISRFTALIPAWIWTEEMARFLFIWMVMLGAMIGVRDAQSQQDVEQPVIGIDEFSQADVSRQGQKKTGASTLTLAPAPLSNSITCC